MRPIEDLSEALLLELGAPRCIEQGPPITYTFSALAVQPIRVRQEVGDSGGGSGSRHLNNIIAILDLSSRTRHSIHMKQAPHPIGTSRVHAGVLHALY